MIRFQEIARRHDVTGDGHARLEGGCRVARDERMPGGQVFSSLESAVGATGGKPFKDRRGSVEKIDAVRRQLPAPPVAAASDGVDVQMLACDVCIDDPVGSPRGELGDATASATVA